MSPISIGKFLLGIGIFGLMWLAFKPMWDELYAVVVGSTGATDFEIMLFQLSPFIIMGIILISLIVAVTKRNRDE